MRNAENPARSYLHQAYLHVGHLPHQRRRKRYPRQNAHHHVVSPQQRRGAVVN
jgi:hypothetical protein